MIKRILFSRITKVLAIMISVLLVIIIYLLKPTSTVQPIPKAQSIICTRTDPYPKSPEFERALSLILQRTHEAESRGSLTYTGEQTRLKDWINCIDIKYENLEKLVGEGTEGVFIFDDTSSLNDLTIYVDNSYKNYDDILTSILLYHEISHVKTHIYLSRGGDPLPCFELEVNAFNSQLMFISTLLNDEERRSLYSRIDYLLRGNYPSNDRSFQTISTLYSILTIKNQALLYCEKSLKKVDINNIDLFNKCVNESIESGLNMMVRETSGYQKQCNPS